MSGRSSRDKAGVDQAITRALRDNLALLQRTADELYHAVNDLVAACSSSRPSNAVPPMLRAQASAAALQGALEVLSKFVTVAMASAPREDEADDVRAVGVELPEPPAAPSAQPPKLPTPMAGAAAVGRREAAAPAPEIAEGVGAEAAESEAELSDAAGAAVPVPFDISTLPWQAQELHRRANRVAKVSMQDIQLMRPEAVRLGRTKKDLCSRLRDDIDKARKEYERRFPAILQQPVDYFYHWMVEILAEGHPEALGEYPYPSPVVHR